MNENGKNETKRLKNGLKILKIELYKYKKDIIALSLLAIASAAASGIIPFFSGKIIDAVIEQQNNIWVFVSSWISISLLSSIIDWRTGIKREFFGQQVEINYTTAGFGRLMELPLSFHKNHKIGNVTHRIMRAASALNRITSDMLIDLLPQFLSIIIALAVTAAINLQLSAIFLVGIALYAFILYKTLPPVANLQNKMFTAYHEAYGDALDALINIQTVKQSNAENYEKHKLNSNFGKKISEYVIKLISIWRNLSFYQKVIVLITQIIILIYSVDAIKNGKMTAGELVMFNSYASMIFGPFLILGNKWQILQRGLTGLVKADYFLKNKPENYFPKNCSAPENIRGEIKFANVSFGYKKGQNILENIDMEILPGEIVALVGESGVGKTTLVDLISGFYFPTEGKVLIDGTDTRKMDLCALRKSISVVPQEIMLFNDSVKNNIRYGKFYSGDEEVESAAKMAHANEFIEHFPRKYQQVVGERGIKLSGGQKQRIAIARSLLKNPKILILDEPTSALDARSEQLIEQSLSRLMKDKTTIIIAHRLSTVKKADKIIVLKDGRIIETGNHDELVKKEDGVYRRLYDLQFGKS
jgi:ABC-type multidrug transport system fused ATPase/permease subunit